MVADQLKERLARDLEQDGRVLPIQLRSAIAGLASLPRLTVAAYQRAGGVRGLEATAVENLVTEAAKGSGLPRESVTHVLTAMVDARPSKTVPQTTAQLERIDGTSPQRLGKALEYLENKKLVRRVTNSDRDDDSRASWRLDHDYQSHAIIAVEKRFDRWNVVLRDAYRAWCEARGDLRKRWQTLLPTHRQLALLWWRLRGRCRFGAARGYWWLSTLRVLPFLAVVGVGWVLALAYRDQLLDEEKALRLFNAIGGDDQATAHEMQDCFQPLARAERERVRWHFLKVGLEDRDNAVKLRRLAELATQAAVGIDDRFRRRVLDDLLVRTLSDPKLDSDANIVLACAAIGHLLDVDDRDERSSAALCAFTPPAAGGPEERGVERAARRGLRGRGSPGQFGTDHGLGS